MENQRRDQERQRTPTCLRAPRTSPPPSPAPSLTTRPLSSSARSRAGGSSPTRRRSTSGCLCPPTWKYQKTSFPARQCRPPWRGRSRGKIWFVKWRAFYHHRMPHSTFAIFPWELCDKISYFFKLSTALITFWMIMMCRKEFLEQHPEENILHSCFKRFSRESFSR